MRAIKTLVELFDDGKPYDGNPLASDMGGPAGRVHDWRVYLSGLEDLWPTLSIETKMAVAIVAQAAANCENWD